MNSTNKFIVLKAIATQGPLSRIELSHMTGLSKMTITSLINEYISNGILRECGVTKSTIGRKPTLLEVVPDSLLTLGVSMGRDVLQVGIINLKGQIVRSENMPFSLMESNEGLLESLFLLCDRLYSDTMKEKIWGIGVSCAGPLSIQHGLILNPPDFNNIHDLHIVKELADRYGLPVYLQNDMCLAALAELYFGNKQQYKNFIYIGISSGIGGGVIINRKLYTGSTGLAGVIGHSIVEINGIPCECGQRGCLEKYSSTRAILQWARQNGADKDLSWMELVSRASSNDEICLRAINRLTDYLEVAITNMESAYDTECFIIGGDLHYCQDMVVKHLEEKLQSRSLIWGQWRKVMVESSSFMGNASIIGTAALVMENNLRT
jgi:predicted NBD/HSP70 family sugar kinase